MSICESIFPVKRECKQDRLPGCHLLNLYTPKNISKCMLISEAAVLGARLLHKNSGKRGRGFLQERPLN